MLYQKEIPTQKSYDLLVCGGGMTGFAAAVTAARHGVKTAIVEKMGCLGGVATSCGVNHFLAGRKYDEHTGKIARKVGGIFDELTDRLIAQGDAVDPDNIDINFNPHGWYPRMAAGIPFHNEKLKILLDEMCREAGVDLYYFTTILDARVEADRISQLILHNKNGLFAFEASYVVDSTGDADVAVFSRCHTVKGRPEDQRMTPATLEMHVERVDWKAYVGYQNAHQSPKLVEIIKKLRKSGEWTFSTDIFIAIQLNEPDVFMVNTIRQMGVDGTDGNSLTQAMIEGRKENFKLFQIMKQHFPGFAQARIRKIFEHIGIRETRRIVGKHTVTLNDALQGTTYDDCIASTTYNFDLPDPIVPGYDPMMGDVANPNAKREHDIIRIPYRALLPEPVTNLIVVGRCVSVEREVLGPIRIMGPCMGMGHAAGLASALALKQDIKYVEVNVKELQEMLIQEKCLLLI
ncbi:MAG: FAD-dependent oxidoreductase [bacterium]|nr:FAD-dependent oxidoreductase [bacterium]